MKPKPYLLGEMLYAERERRGDSLRAAADEMGVSHSALHRWERAMDVPLAKFLPGVAAYLGMSLPNIVLARDTAYRALVRRRTT